MSLQRWVGSVLLVAAGVLILARYDWLAALGLSLQLLAALCWLGSLTLAAWGAGEGPWRWLGDDGAPPLTAAVERLALGAGVLMAAAAGLAVLHLLELWALVAVLAAAASRGAILLWRQPPCWRPPPTPWWLVLAGAAVTTLLIAMTTSPLYDVWHYQLAFPFHWLRAGTVVTFARNSFSFFPANMGLLFTFGLAGPGIWAAQLCHWWMGAVAVAGVAALAREAGGDQRQAVVAACFFAASPTMVAVAPEALADLGVTAFAAAAWLAVVGLARGASPRRAGVLAGVFAGLAAGCKYPALATVVAPVAVVVTVATALVLDRARFRRALLAGIGCGLAATVAFAPWAVRNLVATGAPLYPFLAATAAGSTAEAAAADEGVARLATLDPGGGAVRSALTLRTFAPRGTGGDVGPLFLWLALAWILWSCGRGRPRTQRWLLIGAAVSVVTWSLGPPLGRYLLPALVLVAAGGGVAVARLSESWPGWSRAALWTVVALVMAANLNPGRTGFALDRIACTLGGDLEHELLARTVGAYPAHEAVAALPDEAVVLLVGEHRSLGLARRPVVEDPFRRPLLAELADTEASVQGMARHLVELGVTHLLVNHREGERVARMNGRERYLEPSTAAAESRLEAFFAERLRLLWSHGSLELYELR